MSLLLCGCDLDANSLTMFKGCCTRFRVTGWLHYDTKEKAFSNGGRE